MKRFILIILSIFYLFGCITVGKRFDLNKVSLINREHTTQKEIIDIFGMPNNITKDSEGRQTFLYLYMKAKPKPTSFIPIVWIFSGGAKTKADTLTIYFNKDGIVEDYETSLTEQEIRTGIFERE